MLTRLRKWIVKEYDPYPDGEQQFIKDRHLMIFNTFVVYEVGWLLQVIVGKTAYIIHHQDFKFRFEKSDTRTWVPPGGRKRITLSQYMD